MNREWKLYIVRCRDGSLYTGITNNLPQRIIRHNSGNGAKYTRSRGPVELVYQEDHLNRSNASQREHEIKKMRRIDKEKLIKNSNPAKGSFQRSPSGDHRLSRGR